MSGANTTHAVGTGTASGAGNAGVLGADADAGTDTVSGGVGSGAQGGYGRTIIACFNGYVTQAIINNYTPLLFVTFTATFGIDLARLSLLITVNFITQLVADLLAGRYVDRIGYKPCIIAAHVAAAIGLVMLGTLPFLLDDPFVGIALAVVVYALGSGLIEVMVSPIVEACPTRHKAKMMSLLHSFYSWGQLVTVAVSTLFLWAFGIGAWPLMACLWALVPVAGIVLFAGAPMPRIVPEGTERIGGAQMLRRPVFWLFFVMMLCAGAAEQGMSQWASAFAESALGVSKVVGDLAGPAAFALTMALSRTLYGVIGHRINLRAFIGFSAALCVGTYLLAAFAPSPLAGLVGCAMTGFAVGIMWPGTFSLAAERMPGGGTLMFALFAVAGDLGCAGGGTLVGMVSAARGDDLHTGILAGTLFALVMLVCVLLQRRRPAKA